MEQTTLPLREWRIDATSYKQHLCLPPGYQGLRHAACGARIRALDTSPEEHPAVRFTRCRECRNAEAIEHDFGYSIAL